ncbi:hypothetical protein TNCV_3597051 [Trichonephila clavipes]|nr:hypothetical protein TNCV_3597051 [Trichonephila clavipes]
MSSPVEMLEDTRNLSDEKNKEPEDCVECERLEEHFNKFRAVYGGRYCSICDEIFLSETDSESHMNTIHQFEVRSCPVCNELCPNRDELFRHLRANHIEYFNANHQALLQKYPKINQSNLPEKRGISSAAERRVKARINRVADNFYCELLNNIFCISNDIQQSKN